MGKKDNRAIVTDLDRSSRTSCSLACIGTGGSVLLAERGTDISGDDEDEDAIL